MLQAHLVISDKETHRILSVTRLGSEAQSLTATLGRFAIVKVHQYHGDPGVTVTAASTADFTQSLRNGVTEARRLELIITAICPDQASFVLANAISGIAATR